MREEHPVHKGASPQSATDTPGIGHPRTPINPYQVGRATKAAVVADAIIEYRTFGDGPQFFLDAIQDALATDVVIMTDEWAEPPYGREELRHSEDDIREFLALVAENLRRRRPWPPKIETGR